MWANTIGLILALAVLAMLITGIALLVRGLERRQVKTPPRCARCGFDLRGLPIPAGREGSRCPECGSDLTIPGGVAHERAVRRWRLATIGAAMVLLALSPGMVKGIASLLTGNPERLTPEWSLANRMRAPAGKQGAAAELVRRIESGAASRARIGRLVEEGLAAQQASATGNARLFIDRRSGVYSPTPGELRSERAHAWLPLLEAAVLHGYASPDQVQRYLANAILVEIYVTGQSRIEVQALSLLGPRLSSHLHVQAEEIAEIPAGRQCDSRGTGGMPPVSWWWAFTLPEDSNIAHITWRIDARLALEKLGQAGGDFSGELIIDLPATPHDTDAIKQWRPMRLP